MPRAKAKSAAATTSKLLDANAKLLGALDYCLDHLAIHQTTKKRLLQARADALTLVADVLDCPVEEIDKR